MRPGEVVWLDGERCRVLTGWGEGVGDVVAAVRRMSDGQRFLWLFRDGFVPVAG